VRHEAIPEPTGRRTPVDEEVGARFILAHGRADASGMKPGFCDTPGGISSMIR
jgi:hypothetical protein